MQNPSIVLQGFLFGIGLFAAMGPKDSFLIKQALIGRYLPILVFICVASDILLITLGVAGIGRLVAQSAGLLTVAVWGGAAYLFWYGGKTLLAALTNKSMPSDTKVDYGTSLRSVCLTALTLSLFNPYALIDTLLVIGPISGSMPDDVRWFFAFGAMMASLLWFSVLTIGTTFLRRFFLQAVMWRVLDTIIASIMFYLGIQLLLFYR
ncbi:LysE/ArgO family amino acid transporter [Solimicrobium silvestre]|uniref:Lysine efflux permease n=1 Tax=Solimicrobium silvestre TaxID=2099400 RepID=A0A2S9GWC4_9BURK|nr:LysE family transporter [Solimicrobium silvestre]PRC92022.1 Lysine efflux permease [Solimicrobium silvestre]